ncbi:MAG: TraB/GumN family protein [Sphingobium sp.]
MKSPLSRWLVASLLLLAGCAPRPARVPAPPPVAVTPALWQVKDADTTIYLFGTVHVLKPGTEWLRPGVKAAFGKADELVLEIIEPEDANQMAAAMATRAIATDGMKLSDRLEPAAREKYQAAMTANGLPWASFEGFNPWMAGMALSVAPLERLGYKAELGVEKTLSGAARAAGKRIGALETVEQQIGYFAALPVEQQVTFLTVTVDGLPQVETEFATLIDHWQKGEPDALAAEMNESLEATPELADMLLTKRNAAWALWIKARLDKPGTVFIAVGAGHLAGRNSVQDQLSALGVASARVSE